MVLVLFKQKIKPDEVQIIKLLKFFLIPIPKGNGLIIDLAELKKPDFQQLANVKMMQKLYRTINQENEGAKPENGSNYFKFYVGGGNNYHGVRQIIKRRGWWHRYKLEQFIGMNIAKPNDDIDSDSSGEEIGGAHFIWT